MLFLSCGTQYTEIVLLLHMNWMIRLNAVYLAVWTVSLRYRMEDQALPFLEGSYILTAVATNYFKRAKGKSFTMHRKTEY